MSSLFRKLIIAGYLAVVIGVHLFGWVGWLTDILVTPLLYLVPTGLALLLFSIGGKQVQISNLHGRSGMVILGYILGSYVLTILFVFREKYSIEISIPASYTVILLFALIGWYRVRTLFQSGIELRVLAYSLPVLIVTYGINYFVFSEYPLRDVFQETHFMKGAMELSRFNILNPSTSDSYIPYIQVSSALLHNVFKYDLLRAQWVTPVFIFFIYVYTFRNFFSAIIPGRPVSPLAIMLGSILFSGLSLTNGGMALIGSILIFTGLMRSYDVIGGAQRTLIHALVISIVLVITWQYHRYSELMFALVTTGIIFYGYMFGHLPKSLRFLFIVILLTITLVYFHRGTLLFVPVVVSCYVLYALLKWSSASPSSRPLYLFFLWLGVLVPAVLVVMVSAIAAFAFNVTSTDPAEYFFKSFNWIVKAALGTEFRGEVMLGYGGKVALAEWARTVTPVFSMLVSIFAVIYGVTVFRGMRDMRGSFPTRVPDVRYMWMWLAGCMVLAFILSGFPYAYRMSAIPLLLFIPLFSDFFIHKMEVENETRNWVVLGSLFAIAAYLCAASLAFYKLDIGQDSSSTIYQQWFTPVSVLYLAALLVMLCVAFVRYKHRVGILLLCVIIPVSVLYDKDSLRVSLMNYSYGNKAPPGISAVSHYSTLDLVAADELYSLDKKSVLVSDPYTLSILRARTGLDSVVTYSNLNLLNKDVERYLRGALRVMVDTKLATAASTKQQLCKNIFLLLNVGASELNYTFYAHNRPASLSLIEQLSAVGHQVGDQQKSTISDPALNQVWIKRAFFSADSQWKLVGILSEKTKLWAVTPPALFGQHQMYYSMNGDLGQELISSVYRNFHVLRNLENKILIFDVDCRDFI